MKPNLASLGVCVGALALVGSGCSDSDATTASPTANPTLGFVSLVDGRVGVVNLDTMQKTAEFRPATRGVQEVGVVRATNELYTGDPTADEIIHYQVSGDGRTVTEVGRFDSPVYIDALTMDRRTDSDQSKLVVSSRVPFLWNLVVPTTNAPQDAIGVYDTAKGEWQGVLQLKSPSRGVIDGHTLYITNVHHRSVAEVDLDTLTVKREEPVGPEVWPTRDAPAVGPKLLALSHDGRWLASADYEGLSITVFDLANNWEKRVVPVPYVPRAVTFSPDDGELWAVAYQLTIPVEEIETNPDCCTAMGTWYDGPQPADEASNATRDTVVIIYDFAEMKETRRLVPLWASQEVTFSPKGTEFFLSTSAGSVLSHDVATLRLTGEAMVGGVGFPVLCGALVR